LPIAALSALLLAGTTLVPVNDDSRLGDQIEDVAFTDLEGQRGRLSDFADRDAVVIALRDPAAPESAPLGDALAAIERALPPQRVLFLYANLAGDATVEQCRDDAKRHGFAGRCVRDRDGALGWALRATRSAEVFVLDYARKLRYRGAITGAGAVAEPCLKDALDALLANARVATKTTEPAGAPLEFKQPPALETPPPPPVWNGQVDRIVQQRCQDCHRPHGAGPFALLDVDAAAGREKMIHRVVADRVMPPWLASPDSGPFLHDLRLAPEQRSTLLKWLQAGCPEGDAAKATPPRTFKEGWVIEPDLVIESNKSFHVPASGVVDYTKSESDFVAPERMWVRGIQIIPSCPEVVHHLAVFVTDPDRDWSTLLDGYLPGKPPTLYQDGVAKLVKKGARFHFSTHYTTNGKECDNTLRVGLILAKQPPKYRIAGFYVRNTDFTIPPGAKDFPIVVEESLPRDAFMLRFIPHMHLRGKSIKIELIKPDGTTLVPLVIPRWNQDWQFGYEFETPPPVPRGTVIRVTSIFDNSKDNPFNPNPAALVRQGPQIWDEMAESWVEWMAPYRRTEADEAGEPANGGAEKKGEKEEGG
jgi:mono/diheme cytochrome c family protein